MANKEESVLKVHRAHKVFQEFKACKALQDHKVLLDCKVPQEKTERMA